MGSEKTPSSSRGRIPTSPAVPCLAELLKKAGYATGGAISAVVLSSQSGIARGFDFWDERVESKRRTSMLDFVQRPGK